MLILCMGPKVTIDSCMSMNKKSFINSNLIKIVFLRRLDKISVFPHVRILIKIVFLKITSGSTNITMDQYL